jgi:hypothetical protein
VAAAHWKADARPFRRTQTGRIEDVQKNALRRIGGIDDACRDRRTDRQFAAADPCRVAIHQDDLVVARSGKGVQLLYLVAMGAALVESLNRNDIDLFGP